MYVHLAMPFFLGVQEGTLNKDPTVHASITGAVVWHRKLAFTEYPLNCLCGIKFGGYNESSLCAHPSNPHLDPFTG